MILGALFVWSVSCVMTAAFRRFKDAQISAWMSGLFVLISLFENKMLIFLKNVS